MIYCFTEDGIYLEDKNTDKRIELDTELDVAKFIKANDLSVKFLDYLVEV